MKQLSKAAQHWKDGKDSTRPDQTYRFSKAPEKTIKNKALQSNKNQQSNKHLQITDVNCNAMYAQRMRCADVFQSFAFHYLYKQANKLNSYRKQSFLRPLRALSSQVRAQASLSSGLLDRFSTALIGRGYKASGFNMLLKSLAALKKQNAPSRNISSNFHPALNIRKNNSAFICHFAIKNVKPVLQTRKVRKARSTFQVPFILNKRRQQAIAINNLIEKKENLNKAALCAWLEKARNASKNTLKTSYSAPDFYLSQAEVSALSPIKVSCVSLAKNLNDAFRVRGGIKKHLVKQQINVSQSNKKETDTVSVSASLDKRNKTHQLALKNRAYIHYRWW